MWNRLLAPRILGFQKRDTIMAPAASLVFAQSGCDKWFMRTEPVLHLAPISTGRDFKRHVLPSDDLKRALARSINNKSTAPNIACCFR